MKKFEDYMRIKDAARYLGVTGNTLRNWERQGKIKVLRDPMNNWRMYLKSDLDAILRKLSEGI